MSTTLDLDQMTTEEKLPAMDELWEDLSQNNVVALPEWHKDILDERQWLIDEGRAEFINWESATEQIRERSWFVTKPDFRIE